MPGLARKLLIVAAVDGVIVQPVGNGGRNGSNSFPAVQIEYGSHRFSTLPSTGGSSGRKDEAGLESHGIVGFLSIASVSFLISISQRQQVAQILGKPIYVITNVSVIPLSSQKEASKVITQARASLINTAEQGETAEDSSDSETIYSATASDRDDDAQPTTPEEQTPPTRAGIRSNSIAEDVIGKQGRFTTFASQWFSRKGWSGQSKALRAENTRTEPPVPQPSAQPVISKPETGILDSGAEGSSTPPGESPIPSPRIPPDNRTKSEDQTYELLPKLLRYTKILFGSRNFFFSYDYDLTRRFSVQDARSSLAPLHSVVDPLYFWNKHLMTPFIENNHVNLVLPLMQGFVGQREFTIEAPTPATTTSESQQDPSNVVENSPSESTGDTEKHNFLLTLISRRSVKRPGLRYLRRGVDDEGNTANTVETEQLLSTPPWDTSRKIHSFLQIRGSIPLYFSQSPYSFKPLPALHHSTETNQLAFERHFRELNRRYGKVQSVSLLDKRETEMKLGETYESFARSLNSNQWIPGFNLGFEWFDFHAECRGMKFENVRRLVNKLENTLDDFGETAWQNGTLLQKQNGIMRTNCMDCLDRTSVVQCAFAQRALEIALKNQGFSIDLHSDSSTVWFNTLWADNGDAISKQYSSTAALKGDYTRTRKRDYRGALNDLGLTLSRYYNNIVNDYFSQACIDYFLGYVRTRVFKEFQGNLQSADPGISIQKVRQSAVETSCKIVISEQSEELLGGWTMLTPHQSDTLRTLPFEESVLLLTDAAVYCCRFDWNLDKVTSFERIDLRSITGITYGTYVTSTLTDTQMDEERNVGLVVVYHAGVENTLRVNTRSLQSLFDAAIQNTSAPSSSSGGDGGGEDDTSPEWELFSWFKGNKRPKSRLMAFKALPPSDSATTRNQSQGTVREIDTVRSICEEIERAATAGRPAAPEGQETPKSMVEEREIIPLAEAKKRTGYLEHLVFDIKKLVWA